MFRTTAWAIALLLCLSPFPARAGDEPQAPPTSSQPPRSLRLTPDPLKRFRAGLRRTIRIDAEDVPLAEVLERLGTAAGFPIDVHEIALEEEGIPLDEPVNLRSRGTSVAAALERILPPLNLTWVVRNDRVLVTSTIVAEEADVLTTHVYDVRPLLEIEPTEADRLRDLLDSPRSYPKSTLDPKSALDKPLRRGAAFFQFGPSQPLGKQPSGLGGGLGVDLTVRHRSLTGPDWLVQTVRMSTGAPESWDDQGGPGAVFEFAGRLYVRQTRETHEEVDAILATLLAVAEGRAPSGAVRPFESPEEHRVRAALDRPITVRFEEKPLVDVLRVLADEARVDITFDEIALDEEGIPFDEPVGVEADGIPLRSVLARVLDPLNLDSIIEADAICITSTIVAEELGNLVIALVDVRDLARQPGGVDEVIDVLVRLNGPPESWADQGGPGLIEPLPGRLLLLRQHHEVLDEIETFLTSMRTAIRDRDLEKAEQPAPKPDDVRLLDYNFAGHDPQEVAALVETMVEADWTGPRDTIRIVGRQLFVRTTLENHLAIDELLSKLELDDRCRDGGP